MKPFVLSFLAAFGSDACTVTCDGETNVVYTGCIEGAGRYYCNSGELWYEYPSASCGEDTSGGYAIDSSVDSILAGCTSSAIEDCCDGDSDTDSGTGTGGGFDFGYGGNTESICSGIGMDGVELAAPLDVCLDGISTPLW